MKRFTQRGAPGACLQVIEPGEIRAGDPVDIVHRPEHDRTVALYCRASTTERTLMPRLLTAGAALHSEAATAIRAYVKKYD